MTIQCKYDSAFMLSENSQPRNRFKSFIKIIYLWTRKPILDRMGRKWCLRQACNSNFGLAWPSASAMQASHQLNPALITCTSLR